jgi:hypothetical protein
MNIEKYELIIAEASGQLNHKINEAIKDGAVPYGAPFYTGCVYAQAMVYTKPFTPAPTKLR